MTLRTLGVIAGSVVLAFVAGWCTGTSGRTDVSLLLNETTIRADVAEVRAAILNAQLDLTQANFGDARRAIQRARTITSALQLRLRESGQADKAGALQAAVARLDDADRLSGALDATATEAAGEALRIVETSVPTQTP